MPVCQGSEYFHKHAGSADKTLKLYQEHYHDLLNDIGKERVEAALATINGNLARQVGSGKITEDEVAFELMRQIAADETEALAQTKGLECQPHP